MPVFGLRDVLDLRVTGLASGVLTPQRMPGPIIGRGNALDGCLFNKQRLVQVLKENVHIYLNADMLPGLKEPCSITVDVHLEHTNRLSLTLVRH